jgi:hypothetical protein
LTVDDVDVEFLPLIYEIIRWYDPSWYVYRKSICISLSCLKYPVKFLRDSL